MFMPLHVEMFESFVTFKQLTLNTSCWGAVKKPCKNVAVPAKCVVWDGPCS